VFDNAKDIPLPQPKKVQPGRCVRFGTFFKKSPFMKQEKPLDRRIQRTRKLLLNSLVGLILEKGYESVSVQDILDRANVGRSTFYAHFENKEQLLFSGHEELMYSLQNINRSPEATDDKAFFVKIFQHAADNHQLARAMLGSGIGNIVLAHFQIGIERHFAAQSGNTLADPRKLAMCGRSFSAALVGMLSWWLEADMPFSVELMAEKGAVLCENFLRLAK
jgi:AcrR family transcriptional regulator